MRFATVVLCTLFAAEVLAEGLTINVPLVGRLVGAGNVLYATSIDVTNNGSRRTAVDFYFDGHDTTGRVITAAGTIGDFGIVDLGGGRMSPATNRHFPDFINDMVLAGMLTPEMRDAGVQGSLLLVFNGYDKSGQGSVTARFYNAFGGGQVGVSLRGHEIAANEPRRLVITVRDTTRVAGSAQTYPNLFINHTGLTPAGDFTGDPITVRVSAVSAATGSAVGVPVNVEIRSGDTASVGRAFQSLGVTPTESETALIVRLEVTSGTAAIQALVSQVDSVTRDGAVFEAVRGDF